MPESLAGDMPSVPSLRLERHFSVKEAEASNELLSCIADGDIEEVHRLLSNIPGGVTSVLNTPSLLVKHTMRTPVMAAAATGDFARFTATLQAFDRQFPNKLQLQRDFEMRMQLTNRDKKVHDCGHAGGGEVEPNRARNPPDGNRPNRAQVQLLFQAVHRAMRRGFGGSEDEFGHHLMLKSADNKTIMMHATASGDSMVLKMVADACRKTIRPQAFWGMITDRGSDGLNLVMHAASCCATPSTLAPAEPSLVNPDIRNKKYEETPGIGDGSSSSDSSAQQGAETPLKETTATTVATNASITTIGAVTIDTASGNTTKKSTVEQMVIVEEDIKNRSGPVVVPVFKVAVHLLEECLWVAEVSEMMETNEGEREDTPMIEALARGDTTMQKLFALRASQLKKDVDQRSELSSMNAEIQSFILGKLIVVFQLLLPQIAEARQLLLLFVMFFIAPIAKVAAESTSPDSKHSGFAASVLVGAPAMFFRGVGTSTVGASFGWSESLSATSMAAATLVIPAVDSFFNSQKASLWSAKLCCKEWRFNWKAYWHLSKVRETSTTKPAQIELPSYSTFSKRPDAIASSRGIEEEKQGAAASAATPILTEHESPDAAPIFTPLGSPEDTIRKSETA